MIRKVLGVILSTAVLFTAGCGSEDKGPVGGKSATGDPAPDPNKGLKPVVPPKGTAPLPGIGK